MPITPRLSRRLDQTLGEEAAAELVNWMQQVDRFDARLIDVATRADLAAVRQEVATVRQDVATVRQDVVALRQEMNAGFGELRDEMKEFRQELAQLEIRLERRMGDLIKWSFVFWVGAVGAIAMLAGVLR